MSLAALRVGDSRCPLFVAQTISVEAAASPLAAHAIANESAAGIALYRQFLAQTIADESAAGVMWLSAPLKRAEAWG